MTPQDHPRTYSLTASGPNGELFLVTDDESGINIGHAKMIGGPLTAPSPATAAVPLDVLAGRLFGLYGDHVPDPIRHNWEADAARLVSAAEKVAS